MLNILAGMLTAKFIVIPLIEMTIEIVKEKRRAAQKNAIPKKG